MDFTATIIEIPSVPSKGNGWLLFLPVSIALPFLINGFMASYYPNGVSSLYLLIPPLTILAAILTAPKTNVEVKNVGQFLLSGTTISIVKTDENTEQHFEVSEISYLYCYRKIRYSSTGRCDLFVDNKHHRLNFELNGWQLEKLQNVCKRWKGAGYKVELIVEH